MRQTIHRIGTIASFHLAATLAAMMASVQLGMQRLETAAGAPVGPLETLASSAAHLLMSPMQQILAGLLSSAGPGISAGPLSFLFFAINSLLWGALLHGMLAAISGARGSGSAAPSE